MRYRKVFSTKGGWSQNAMEIAVEVIKNNMAVRKIKRQLQPNCLNIMGQVIAMLKYHSKSSGWTEMTMMNFLIRTWCNRETGVSLNNY